MAKLIVIDHPNNIRNIQKDIQKYNSTLVSNENTFFIEKRKLIIK